MKNLISKNCAFKKKVFSLTKNVGDFLKEKKNKLTCDACVSLKIEKPYLDDKVEDLVKIVHKFINKKKNFDMMLDKQRGMFDKGGTQIF